jgi:predicted signal transduction protein with EAL and GGDEF domain
MVSDRVLDCVRDTDMVARFGGDEFAVLQVALHRADEATLLAARIVEAVGKPFHIDGQQVTVGASVGIAAAPENGATAEELLKKADLALYRAKAEGRGTYRFFEPAMDAAAQERRALEVNLRNALANREFTLEYHALVGLDRDEVSGFEALLRWSHPTRGVILPSEFFRVAEELGLMVPIGGWVLHQACADAANWPEHMKVAVDVWPAQFRSGALVDQVLQALASSGLAPSRLELEITESVLLQDKAGALDILHQLRELGVRISMDDFGTGYSCLSYLRSFPFDKVKIDRSFVRALSEDGDSIALLQAVRGLSSSLSVATTADGVESREQLDRLRAEGCKEVQGYYFGPPRSAGDIPSFLATLNETQAAA